MYKHIYAAFLITTALFGFSEFCFSQNMEANSEQTSFDQYSKVDIGDSYWRADIFVFDKRLFLNNRKTKEHFKDEEGVDFESMTVGDIMFSPAQRVYINQGVDPTHWYYEIRDVGTNNLLLYLAASQPSFLFNGQGTLYVKSTPGRICTSSKKEVSTRKYILANGKFEEVKQPFVFWENVTSNISIDLILYLSPDSSSLPVARLLKGTKVQVLTQDKNWFLIKTPLGLTGWIPDTHSPLADLFGCG